MWIAMEDNGVCHFYDDIWHVYRAEDIGVEGSVTGVTLDPSGHVWIAVTRERSVSLVTYDGTMWKESTRIDKSHKKEEIRHIIFDSVGNPWVAWYREDRETRLGLWVSGSDGQQWTKFTKTNSNLPYNEVTALAIDKVGRVWAQTGSGVAIFEKRQSSCWITVEPGVIQESMSRQEAERIATEGDQLSKFFLGGGPCIDEEGRVWMLSRKGLVVFWEE
jgi:streptogramin lyase